MHRLAIMLIAGLVCLAVAAQAALPSIDSGEIETSEYVDDKQMNNNERDQISVLSRQLKMLTERRQEDYRMLERSLHSYVEKHFEEYLNVDIKKELKDLR